MVDKMNIHSSIRELAPLPQIWRSVFNTHDELLTTTHNSNSRGCFLLLAMGTSSHICTNLHADIHIYKKNLKYIINKMQVTSRFFYFPFYSVGHYNVQFCVFVRFLSVQKSRSLCLCLFLEFFPSACLLCPISTCLFLFYFIFIH